MELLLNLAWLLLALPAYQLWRRSRRSGRRQSFSSLQCLLALGCMLVMLFPVISATDDLHVMRAEIEESPASKRTIRHGGDRNSGWVNKLQTPPAAVVANGMLHPAVEVLERVALSPCPPPARVPVARRSGRAPPAPSLA